MFAEMVVILNRDIRGIYNVAGLEPILGNSITLATLLIDKYCDIDKEWTIESFIIKDNNSVITDKLYPLDVDKINYKTIEEVLDSATSDDISDMVVIPKVKVTEKIVGANTL